METAQLLQKQIKNWIVLFIILLVLSGVTAFPLETELKLLNENASFLPIGLQQWISRVYAGVSETNQHYKFMAYGTDWLAFAHIVISIFFFGLLKDPVRNIFIIKAGMVSCIAVFPLAFIAGPVRGIPFYWQLIDCSFGVFGFLLLRFVYRKIKRLEIIEINNLSAVKLSAV